MQEEETNEKVEKDDKKYEKKEESEKIKEVTEENNPDEEKSDKLEKEHLCKTNVKKNTSNGMVWVVTLVVVVSSIRIGNGVFFSLSGPTLLYLADNVDSSVAQVSSMFAGRSVGSFVGSLIFAIIKNRLPKHKPLALTALWIVLAGTLISLIPWVTNLPTLVVISTITGLAFGYFDAGLQSLYLELWGEKKSRPYVQSFHFSFGIGAFFAPIIAAPFLAMANQTKSIDDSCPILNQETTTISSLTSENTTISSPPYPGLNPVAWTYIMSGAFTIVIGGVMFVCALLRIEDKVRTNHSTSAEQRKEEAFRSVAVFFIPVALYFFACSSSEAIYQSFVYSIAYCSDLGFTAKDAAALNTLFWVGFVVGRGSGVIYAKYFSPTTIIIADLIGTTTAVTILSIFGRYSGLVLWIVTLVHGLTVATLYPSGISWLSLITNVSGTYILIFGAGSTLGAITMLPLSGALFEIDPFYVVYQILALSVSNVVIFLLLTWLGKKRLQSRENQATRKLDKNKIKV